MPAALAGPVARIKSVLSTVSLGQKVMIGLLLVGLLIGGIFFYRWITAPTYAPLFSNLAATDASAIVDELNTEGVSYQLTDGGQTIMVAKDQVYNLRLTMSGKGLPAGQDTGYSLLDQQGITTSQFQQQVTYQRAVEGELAKTLEAIHGVKAAVVHIALPKDTVFTDDQGKPTASVLLDLTAGTKLAGEQIQAVTNLVSSAIEGMSPNDVTVADSSGEVLSAAGTGLTAAAGDTRSQLETDYENRLAANAQQILDRVLGPNHAQVSVRADLDLSQKNSTSVTHQYNQGTPPESQSSSTETYSGAGTPVGGVLGPNSTTTTAGGGNSSYNKTDTTQDNSVDTTTTTAVEPPGTIQRLTVSVVMDGRVAGNINPQQVQSLVSNAVGLDTTRGDAITVASMPFDTSAAKQAAQELAAERVADQQAQMWSLVKTGAIGLGIAVVILLVWLRSRRRREEFEEDYEPLELTDDMLAELDRLRVASTRDETSAADREAMELEAAERQRVRSDISSMISERPDEVAAMLRGWLSESKS